MKKKFGIAIMFALIIMQFFQIEKTNPDIDLNQDFLNIHAAPLEISKLFKDACYDCHSHETRYPWYTSVAPISFWIKSHINEGRQHINYSIWNTYSEEKKSHKIEEAIEMIEEKSMPLTSYIIAHPEARISESDRAKMVQWLKEL